VKQLTERINTYTTCIRTAIAVNEVVTDGTQELFELSMSQQNKAVQFHQDWINEQVLQAITQTEQRVREEMVKRIRGHLQKEPVEVDCDGNIWTENGDELLGKLLFIEESESL
jgi:hypothetical protein